MTLKEKLQKLQEENKQEKQDTKPNTTQVLWLEKAYSKDARYSTSKVYSK